ncbi:MAG: hypothetical protein Q9187_001103 [Circinaria calcarea]
MSALKVGDTFPEGVVFSCVPYTEEKNSLTSCGVPISYNASKEWADKKVVLFAVPGAFTPSCSVQHLPGFIKNLDKIKSKGVDIVAVLAYNDPFVMSAWSKANSVKNDDIVRAPTSCHISKADMLAFLDRFGNQVFQENRLDDGRTDREICSHN